MTRNSAARVRWWVPVAAVTVGWLLALLNGCLAQSIPTTKRPDTRRIVFIAIDSLVGDKVIELFRKLYPVEASVCWRGVLSDTTVDGESWIKINIHDFSPAIADSANEFRIWYSASNPGGCVDKDVVGISHDHTHMGPVCAHSPQDANLLFLMHKALFSMVFCGNGEAEILYQDGRHFLTRWAPQ